MRASWDYPAIVASLQLDELAVDDDPATPVSDLGAVPPVDVPKLEVVLFEIQAHVGLTISLVIDDVENDLTVLVEHGVRENVDDTVAILVAYRDHRLARLAMEDADAAARRHRATFLHAHLEH